MWERLPDDLIDMILRLTDKINEQSAGLIQKTWKGYKVRCLIRTFKAMQYLQEFRYWNPSFRDYYQRTSKNNCCMY